MRARRMIAGIMAISVLALALAGCGGTKSKDSTTTPAPAPSAGTEAPKKAPVEVVVWSNLTEGEQAAATKVAQAWAAETGNKIQFINIQSGFQEAAAAIAAGKGPDLHFGLPHDNLGVYHKAGFLQAVPDGVLNKADYVPMTIDAVSYDGKMFAVPIAYESIALMYNKALVKEAPKTWDDFIRVAKEKGFAFDIKNFYFSYGFIAGMGGYVFKNVGGGLDPKDVGLANDGAKAGLKLLEELVYTHKLMPNDVNYDMAKGLFVSGKQGMYLSGPWDLADIQGAKIDLGVAPMPTLPNGKPFVPFVGVYAAFVSSASKVQPEAWALLKYMQENGQVEIHKAGGRTPAVKKWAESADVKANALSAGFGASGANGVPMPNIPAMSAVWGPAGQMIGLVVDKQATPDKAAKDALTAINEAVAALK